MNKFTSSQIKIKYILLCNHKHAQKEGVYKMCFICNALFIYNHNYIYKISVYSKNQKITTPHDVFRQSL